MGYDLHITRAKCWLEGNTHPISLAEWTAIVTRDPDLRMDGYAQVILPSGEALRYENPGLAVWLAHPETSSIWFDFCSGNIVVKNPDESTIAKMKAIAVLLDATVQGDDDEIY